MQRLEEIVRDLETGELPLEKAIKKFEEGVRLSKFCSKKLDETEKRITLLFKDNEGHLVEKPFSALDEGNKDV